MGKLVTIIGNSGVGKTTLAHLLGEQGGFSTGLEVLGERPFQESFKHDSLYALANQVDFFLERAEQEKTIRSCNSVGILDGGLEMDYYVFSHLFQLKGYLSSNELGLLSRLFALLRTNLPAPDLIIYLYAPLNVIINRFTARNRPLEITALEDIPVIQNLLEKWLENVDSRQVLRVDVSSDSPLTREALTKLSKNIRNYLNRSIL